MAEQLLAEPASFEREADRRLFNAIRRRLWDYEALRATHPKLELEVHHGSIRLGGRVRTQAMKEIAGYLCRREDEVGVVRNEIVSDTEVVYDVAAALASEPQLGPLCLRVDVRDGIATLSGELPAPDLEASALEAARRVPTVEDVFSNLTVRPPTRPPTAPPPQPAIPAAEEATA